jgi:hypothetical protein
MSVLLEVFNTFYGWTVYVQLPQLVVTEGEQVMVSAPDRECKTPSVTPLK